MAVTGAYKNTGRSTRVIDVEEMFGGGMLYQDTPIREGFCKTLTNYELLDKGDKLKTRKAYVPIQTVDLGITDTDYMIHHSGRCLVDFIDDDDAKLMEYVLLGTYDGNGVDFDSSKLYVRDITSGTIDEATLSAGNEAGATVKSDSRYNLSTVHNEAVADVSPVGVYNNVDDNIYMMYEDGLETGIGRLRITESGGDYEYELERISPKSITPHQAVNYGYNLLEDNPYIFDNSVSATGALQLLGVLPYDSDDNLKFGAQVGEEITFKLVYKYPDDGTNYKVQWEVQDTEALSGVEIIQKVSQSNTYSGGDSIEHTFSAPFKKFSVIVRVYDSSDTTAPLRSIVLANYYLADDSTGSNRNIEVNNYDIGTATGMANFMHKTVVWGVKDARNTIFLSDVNDPSYFPYPQGAEPYSEPIVKAVPLLENLYVFTETKIYELTPDYETGGFNNKVVQDNLDIKSSDSETIITVKNMIYFRSGGEYFMIVPSGNQGQSLSLAPISQNITDLLNNYAGAVRDIFENIYQPEMNFDEVWSLSLLDNYTYLDNTQMKNVYKYQFDYGDSTKYFEFVLAYDTFDRSWTTSILETNDRPLTQFRKIITADNIYLNLYVRDDGNLGLQFIGRDENSANDNIKLDDEVDSVIKNLPYLDSGLRAHSIQYKKRFREFNFLTNNIDGIEIEFRDEFSIDGGKRTKLYNYHTELVEDPADPQYGQLSIVKEFTDPAFLPPDLEETTAVAGKTVLGYWKLGYSQFPNMELVRTRIKVSGKGYSGRIKLLCNTEAMFEILNFGWVYRMMNAR